MLRLFCCLFCFSLIVNNSAFAVTLFEENFNSYADTAAFDAGITNGTSGWHGGQFQAGVRPTLSNIGVVSGGPLVFGSGKVGWFADDAGILVELNTVGFDQVFLSFQWRTVNTNYGDAFKAGYYNGDIDGDFGANNVAPLYALHGPFWFNNSWTTIASGLVGGNGNWVTNYILPGGVEHLWLAFWFNDARLSGGWDCAYGVVDNITVTGNGNPIPEPATLLLFGSGMLGALGVSSRKRVG